MPQLKKIIYSLLLLVIAFIIGGVIWIEAHYVTPIITYHNIGDHQTGMLNTVSAASFEHHMDYIKRHRIRVVSMDEWVTALEHGQMLRNCVVIHFDDGFLDNYTQAYPILRKYGFEATVFLISDLMGKDERFMTWEQIKQMSQGGITFGAHTRRHPYLPSLSHDEAVDEIAGSKRVIEENLGKSVDFFVYPSGGFTDQVKNIVKESGYRAAATTNRGRNRYNKDLFELNRIRLKNSDRDIVLWAKLSGFYNIFRSEKKPH